MSHALSIVELSSQPVALKFGSSRLTFEDNHLQSTFSFSETAMARTLNSILILWIPAEAWQEFDDDGRMKDSSFRDRVVDVMEEFYKRVPQG